MGESWMKRKIWITVISAACCSRCRVVFNAEICLTTYTPCDCTSFVTLWVNKFLTKALCVSFLTWIVCQDNPILVERDEIVCRAFDAHLPVGLRNLSESSHRFMREHTHIVQLLTRVSPSRFVDHGVYFFMNESHVHGEYSWASFLCSAAELLSVLYVSEFSFICTPSLVYTWVHLYVHAEPISSRSSLS